MTMAASEPPATAYAGDTWRWSAELADYPASAWAATWSFENGTASFTVNAVASGDTHTVSVPSVITAAYNAGRYRWHLYVVNMEDATRATIDDGWTEVRPNPAAGGNVDHRSTARVVLDMIDAYLRDPTNIQAASYSLGNRSLSRWSRAELLVERSKWELEVLKEQQKESMEAGLGNPRRLYARFVIR
jgi:hypothetical protein